MDILGIKYFGRSAFKYLRGTAREGNILSDSVKIIKQNVQNAQKSGRADNYDLRICRKNAFYSIFLHAFMFIVSLFGVWWCMKIGLMWSAGACLAVGVIFGMYTIRAVTDYEYMSSLVQTKNE